MSRALVDPTDLDAVLARLADGSGSARAAGTLPAIGLRRIVIGPDALDQLVDVVAAVRRPGPVVVLADSTPMRRGPLDLKREVKDRLADRFSVVPAILHDERGEVRADGATIARARQMAAGAGCVVAVGSGTICDIGKAAADPSAPYVVVQTACSVNAFSDDLAVLLVDGVKRTVRARWPDALLIDLQVIADAPLELNQAGVGELLSMFTAPADWYLAAALGVDAGFDERIVALFRDGGELLLAAAPRVGRSDWSGLRDLAALMTLSGLALGIAGRSAPISGLEHAVSHLLDMSAERVGRPVGRHGAQVGVASVVAAAWWAALLAEADPERWLRVDKGWTAGAGSDGARVAVEMAFRHVDASGAMAAECWRDVQRKLNRWEATVANRAQLLDGWEHHRSALARLTAAPHRMVEALRSAGAPARFSELDPPVPPDAVRWAFRSAPLLRDRLTIADVAWLGARSLKEAQLRLETSIERALADAELAGGGL